MKCPKCLTCQYFAWWDGDYVCMERFRLLSNKHGKQMFDDDLIAELKKMKFCPEYSMSLNKFVVGMHIEEFNKWNELYKLEKQLERHVK